MNLPGHWPCQSSLCGCRLCLGPIAHWRRHTWWERCGQGIQQGGTRLQHSVLGLCWSLLVALIKFTNAACATRHTVMGSAACRESATVEQPFLQTTVPWAKQCKGWCAFQFEVLQARCIATVTTTILPTVYTSVSPSGALLCLQAGEGVLRQESSSGQVKSSLKAVHTLGGGVLTGCKLPAQRTIATKAGLLGRLKAVGVSHIEGTTAVGSA